MNCINFSASAGVDIYFPKYGGAPNCKALAGCILVLLIPAVCYFQMSLYSSGSQTFSTGDYPYPLNHWLWFPIRIPVSKVEAADSKLVPSADGAYYSTRGLLFSTTEHPQSSHQPAVHAWKSQHKASLARLKARHQKCEVSMKIRGSLWYKEKYSMVLPCRMVNAIHIGEGYSRALKNPAIGLSSYTSSRAAGFCEDSRAFLIGLHVSLRRNISQFGNHGLTPRRPPAYQITLWAVVGFE